MGSLWLTAVSCALLSALCAPESETCTLLLASPPWQSGLFLGWQAPRILFPSPPMLAFSQKRGATSAFKSEALPPCGAAFSSDEGPRLSRSAHTFFRAVRIFLSGLVDSAAFQEVSLGREVSIIFTSSGFLIYRQEANNGKSSAVEPID